MDLEICSSQHLNTINAYTENAIKIQNKTYKNSILVTPESSVRNWSVPNFSNLEKIHFSEIIFYKPAIIILGTEKWYLPLKEEIIILLAMSDIGIECMKPRTAYGTYNVLALEGRNVLGAFLLE